MSLWPNELKGLKSCPMSDDVLRALLVAVCIASSDAFTLPPMQVGDCNCGWVTAQRCRKNRNDGKKCWTVCCAGAEAAGQAKIAVAEKQGVISHAKARRRRRAAHKAKQKEEESSGGESLKWRAEAIAAMKQQQQQAAVAAAVEAPEQLTVTEPLENLQTRLPPRQRLRKAAKAALAANSPGLAVSPSGSLDRYDRMFGFAFAAVSICLVAVCVVAACVAFF